MLYPDPPRRAGHSRHLCSCRNQICCILHGSRPQAAHCRHSQASASYLPLGAEEPTAPAPGSSPIFRLPPTCPPRSPVEPSRASSPRDQNLLCRHLHTGFLGISASCFCHWFMFLPASKPSFSSPLNFANFLAPAFPCACAIRPVSFPVVQLQCLFMTSCCPCVFIPDFIPPYSLSIAVDSL